MEKEEVNVRNGELLLKVENDVENLVETLNLFSNFKLFKNEELIQELEKAKKLHEHWVDSFEEVVLKNEKLLINNDGNKCGSGILTNNIPQDVRELWNEITKKHLKLHEQANRSITKDRENNEKVLKDVKQISKELEDLLNKVITMLNQ